MGSNQVPSTHPASFIRARAILTGLGGIAAHACLVIPCLILPTALIVFLIEGPRGFGEFISSNLRHFEISLFLICVAFGFAALRTLIVTPRFGHSPLRLAISAILMFPVCMVTTLAVESVSHSSFTIPSPALVAAFVTTGCLIELAVAAATVGRRGEFNRMNRSRSGASLTTNER